jgi:hypothetical protein
MGSGKGGETTKDTKGTKAEWGSKTESFRSRWEMCDVRRTMVDEGASRKGRKGRAGRAGNCQGLVSHRRGLRGGDTGLDLPSVFVYFARHIPGVRGSISFGARASALPTFHLRFGIPPLTRRATRWACVGFRLRPLRPLREANSATAYFAGSRRPRACSHSSARLCQLDEVPRPLRMPMPCPPFSNRYISAGTLARVRA